MKVTHKCSRLKKNSSWITIMYHLISNKIKVGTVEMDYEENMENARYATNDNTPL
jgi:hypothetical protein